MTDTQVMAALEPIQADINAANSFFNRMDNPIRHAMLAQAFARHRIASSPATEPVALPDCIVNGDVEAWLFSHPDRDAEMEAGRITLFNFRMGYAAPVPSPAVDAEVREQVARIISLAKGKPEDRQTSTGAWWWDARHDRARPEHFEGECRDEDRAHADLMIPLLRQALATPGDAEVRKEMPVLIEWIIELARRDINREQTDFIGRMHQAMGDFEFACEHWANGEVDEAGRDDVGEALASLAGLALAQLAMVSNADDPLFALATPSGRAQGEVENG